MSGDSDAEIGICWDDTMKHVPVKDNKDLENLSIQSANSDEMVDRKAYCVSPSTSAHFNMLESINYDCDTIPDVVVETEHTATNYFPSISQESCSSEKHDFLNIQENFSQTSQTFKKRQPKTVEEKLALMQKRQRENKEKMLLKELKQKEKIEKKNEDKRNKALKKILVENHKLAKPEENLKLVTVHLDKDLICFTGGGKIIVKLQECEVQCSIESLAKPYSITWSRLVHENVLNDTNELIRTSKQISESEIVHLLQWREVIELVATQEMLAYCQTVKNIFPDKNLTLIIFGLTKYFGYHLNKKKKSQKKSFEAEYENCAVVSKDDLTCALAELQLCLKANCRFVDSPEDLGTLVLQFTKSIAQAPYRRDKYKQEADNVDWYASGSSKQCVVVDKQGNGCVRLWQQQLCQFPNVGLEIAEAIIAQYPSPRALVSAYKKCSTVKEGESLIQDLTVRRNAGILASIRKVGPEMSKKLYYFFNSKNPDLEL